MPIEQTVTPYGQLAARFDCAELAELCVEDTGVQTGPFGSQLHQKDYVSSGTPIITVEHIGENRILHQDLPRVTDHDRQRLGRYSLQKGDIVFSRVGSVDLRALVRDAEDGWLFSGRCLRVRPNKERIYPEYLAWFFGLPSFKEHVRRIAVGATMPSLNTKILSELPIYFPPLPEQRAIAGVLGALDDKIELNRGMNETLEALAQAEFGRLKDEGGGVEKLGDLIDLAYGKALKEEDRQPGNVPVFGSNGQVGWHDEKLVDGPGIIVGRKGNPGIVTWSHTDFFPIDTTFYVVPKGKCRSLYFLYYALRDQDLASLGADSAVPGLNRNMAYLSEQFVPPPVVLEKFDKIVAPLYARIHANDEESRTLAALRDALLPKLLSGEVRVKEIESTR